MKLDIVIKKYALINAILHNGKASNKAVLGKVIAEHPEAKNNLKELIDKINKTVNKINKLTLEKQKELLEKEFPNALKKEKKEKDLPELPNAQIGKVVTRIPPEPSKYAHIGHALSFLINYLYAKKYKGKCILRFEDTNPEKSKQEYVDSMLDDILNYLDIRVDKIIYVSDDMEKFYEHAEKLIKDGKAYVCFCPQEKVRELRKKGVECECRKKGINENLKEWKGMLNGAYKEGECTLRLKIDMKHKNYAMRDPIIFRIIEKEHYRHGKKYRVWPMYDFENALEDCFNGITHILRSNEFGKMREELQNYIKDLFGYKKQTVIQYGRFNIIGAITQGRVIREMIEKHELIGWDDPRLVTLKALRKRGIVKEALYALVKHVGLSQTQTNIEYDVIAAYNRKIIDKFAKRLFFIENPIKIRIVNAPSLTLKLKFHPEIENYGYRTIKTNEYFYIEKSDFNEIKEGKIYRLMDCLNFYLKNNTFYFHSLDYNTFKEKGDRIMHWLPADEKEITQIKIMMDNASIISGLAEKAVNDIKYDEIVQFERFGFCRKDKEIFYFTHK